MPCDAAPMVLVSVSASTLTLSKCMLHACSREGLRFRARGCGYEVASAAGFSVVGVWRFRVERDRAF
eukprot:15445342-Alexandrium_andersonii.AAC.3